ncbi:MAG TPA: hypothetical protein V6C90_06445 [Coleofasciculaceae cyanobacterium]
MTNSSSIAFTRKLQAIRTDGEKIFRLGDEVIASGTLCDYL